MRTDYAIGVDIGATKTLAVACDTKGHILTERWQRTLNAMGKDAVLRQLLTIVDNIRQSSDLAGHIPLGVGVGFAGLVDYETGVVRSSIMLPDWVEVPLQSIIEQHSGLPARIDNDANAAAYGEWWVGAGRGVSTLVCLTIGTGIGGGLIINKALYRGPDGTAAEFGNMTIDYKGPLCDCGNRGCLNPLASGTAIARRARASIEQGESSSILELVEGKFDQISARIVAEAAHHGDDLANRLISETAIYLGAGIANLVNALNPDVVVLSGGVVDIGDLLIDKIRAEVSWRAFELPARRARILPAALGNHAGAVGAAGILIEALRLSVSRVDLNEQR